MKRLDLSNIKANTSISRDKVILGTIQAPVHFTGNNIHSEVCPITYNDLSDNVIYYDGDEYTVAGSSILKNGTPVFTVDDNKIVMTEVEGNDMFSSPYATISGDTISWNNGTATGTITGVSPSYDYKICSCMSDTILIITLFPLTPTAIKNIVSYTVTPYLAAGIAAKTITQFALPYGQMLAVQPSFLLVNNTDYVVRASIDDYTVYLSGDDSHVLFTALSTTGYYYSNLAMVVGSTVSYLNTNGMLLATSQDGIYYGGFKTVNGEWSIDYYGNRPVQVSYNGKIMANDFDYAYFSDDGSPVILIDGKYYKLSIESGCTFNIVSDRYIVANSPNTKLNTYDMNTGELFCRNESYAGTLLWTLNPSNLLLDEDDAERRTTFYVASSILTNGLTDGKNVQGTIFPSFPVWGLEHNNFELFDFYGDTIDRISPIEVYKGTDTSPTVAEFMFSLGGTVDYTGYVYPDSTNTLYSVSELDNFQSSFSNYIIINKINHSYISAVNNIQEATFSYYVGTMNELQGVFILRGTVYGITSDGYIVAYTITNGAISDFSVITKIGTMQYIGHTQEYALFYSPYEKEIYQFDSTLKLSLVADFSIGEIQNFTCRPEDNKIAVSTGDCIYVFSSNNVFQIPVSTTSLSFCKGWLLAGDKAYSSYNGDKKLDVEYDTGKIGNSYDTTVQLDEIDVMLDSDELDVPPYLEYRLDMDTSIGETKEITIDDTNIIRIRPTTTRNEGLYYRLYLKTNCNIMGISIIDNAEKKPNLTRNNG